MAYHGKSRHSKYDGYATRKSFRAHGEERTKYYSYYINKKIKRIYNRWLRNSRNVPELKNNNWKKTSGCNLWNWY